MLVEDQVAVVQLQAAAEAELGGPGLVIRLASSFCWPALPTDHVPGPAPLTVGPAGASRAAPACRPTASFAARPAMAGLVTHGT